MSSSESAAQIEQFLILAKGQKAKALETIIEQILSHPSIYVFGEFLSQPNFQEIGSENKHFKTLELFAYDNFVKFKDNKEDYIDLKPNQIKKLKMISIVDMAQKSKILHYQDLMRQLDMQDLRELEDLIIDCMYNQLLSGKLDQFNQQFQVVHTYGRDLRESDIDAMLSKLADWDKQLEKSQIFIEKNVQDCNTSIMNTYEKQLELELELREKRDKMLKDIEEGKDLEFAGSGPGLGKKKSRRDDGKPGGTQGFLGGFKQEMKKAQYHQHQPKHQLLNDDYQGDDQPHSSTNNTNFYPREDPSSNLTLEGDEEDDEIDINQISNKELEEKIRKMREQIRRKQEGIEESPGDDEDENDSNYVEDDVNDDGQDEDQEDQYSEEDGDPEKDLENTDHQDQEEFESEQDESQSFGHEDEELTESQLKKIDLKSKIDQMKQAIAQYQNQSSVKSDYELSKSGQRSLEYNDNEQTSTNNMKHYQSTSSKEYDMTGNSSSKHQQKHNFKQDSKTNRSNMKTDDFEKESLAIKSKNNMKSQKSLHTYNPKYNNSQTKKKDKKNAREESEEEEYSHEESENDNSEQNSYDEDNDIPLESEVDDEISRYTIKSRKSQRRGIEKDKTKSPEESITINPQFDMSGFPLNPLSSPQMFGMNGENYMQNPMGMNPLFMSQGASPNMLANPLLGINPQMFPIPPGMTNPNDIALFQQQQLLQNQQAQQTFGPNGMPNFMLQQPGQQPAILAQQNMMLNQQQQQLQQQLTQSQQQQQIQQQETQKLQQQLQSANQEIQTLSTRLMDQDKEVQQLQMLLHDQKIQYEQEIKMMSRETQYKYDDYQRLIHDNQFLIDKAETAQQKYQALKREFDNQKEFYEKALEQRFSQMEEFEEECMQLRQKVQELQDRENDNKIKCDLAMKDKEAMKRKLEIKDQENFSGTQKEQDLLAKIEELQKQLKEKESTVEKKVEESFNLKQKIDSQRQDIDKLKKKVENLEDQVTHKEFELRQVNEDFENFKKKQKYEQTSMKNHAQGVNDDLKNELMVEKQQNQALRAQLEHQADQLYDLQEQLDQSEQIRRERDFLRKENQELQMQIKHQRPNNESMVSNNGSRSSKNNRQFRDDFSESTDLWRNQEPHQRSRIPKQNNYMDQQENTTTSSSNKYNLPPSFFKDNDYTEDQILNEVYSKKPLVNDRANNIPPRGQPIRQGSSSYIPPGIQTKQDKEREQKMSQVKNIEQNLLSLQLEQKRLQSEFDKIPDNAKTIAQRRRKEELDNEIRIVNKNISGLKNKLRELDALHR